MADGTPWYVRLGDLGHRDRGLDACRLSYALEIGCEVLLLGKNGVDGVYSADPRIDPAATRFDAITYDEVLQRGLDVADATAFSLCRDNGMPIIVFGLADGNIARVVRGEKIGTLVSAAGGAEGTRQ